jgi:pimeloyl-ACP methyl ester carboxylesterase
MAGKQNILREDESKADVSLLDEARIGVEILVLHASPVYWGFGVPSGDSTGVVLIPAFMSSDLYLAQMYGWLQRIGYRPYFSGLGLNAECPNLLIQNHLNDTVERALSETGAKVHLIGHSLGGIIARSLACQRPSDIASVTTLGAPFRGVVAHSTVLRITQMVRNRILRERGRTVLPECYTGRCTCDFLDHLRRDLPASVRQTAVYTCSDGLVDWRYCITGDPGIDCEVNGSHIGLAFNPGVYSIIAARLAGKPGRKRNSRKRTR